MQASTLSAKDIACRRGDRILFRGLNVELVAGDAMLVMGANGVGKTSLLRILCGLLRPFAGSVASGGSFALMNDRAALDPELPLRRALSFWADLDGADGDRVAEHARRTNIDALLDIPVRYLSTGQMKRAAFARLLAQDAAIWLLDEPLNGVDTDGRAVMERSIADHRAAGGIAVIASHQPVSADGLQTLSLADFAP